MKAEITKIKVKLSAEREIELTASEARQLQAELNKLFELEKSTLEKLKEEWDKQNPKPVPYPYPVYPAPISIERDTPFWPRPWDVWCGDYPTAVPNVTMPSTTSGNIQVGKPFVGDILCMSLGAS